MAILTEGILGTATFLEWYLYLRDSWNSTWYHGGPQISLLQCLGFMHHEIVFREWVCSFCASVTEQYLTGTSWDYVYRDEDRTVCIKVKRSWMFINGWCWIVNSLKDTMFLKLSSKPGIPDTARWQKARIHCENLFNVIYFQVKLFSWWCIIVSKGSGLPVILNFS